MSEPMQHSPIRPGGSCRRCGLRHSTKTAYVACFEPGDTFDTWKSRQPEEVVAMVEEREPGPDEYACATCGAICKRGFGADPNLYCYTHGQLGRR